MYMIHRVICSVFLLFCVTSVYAGINNEGGAKEGGAKDHYKVSPGNSLKITVYEEPDLSAEVKVGDDGYITYPLVGRIKVTGFNKGELEELITHKLKDGYVLNPQVMVAIVSYSSFYIYGEVSKPGEYKMDGNVTILEALALAGGFSRIASPNGTRVIREKNGKKETFYVKVGDISKNKESKTFILEAGDVVFVPESFF